MPNTEPTSEKDEQKDLQDPKKPTFKERFVASANVLGVATKAFWMYISHFIWIFAFGISLNIGLYIFSAQEVSGLTGNVEVVKNLIGYGTMAAFFVVFPFIFFFLGQRHGMKSAVASVVAGSKGLIFGYFVDKFFDYVQKNPMLKDKLRPERLDELLQETLPDYLRRLDNMKGILKRVFQKIIQKIDLQRILLQAKEDLAGNITLETLKHYIVEKASEKVPIPLLTPPSLMGIFIVTLLNLGVFTAIKVLFPL